MARVTQKAIAEQLGFSTSLVSRALNGSAEQIGILPVTVRLIEKTAEEMGYVPNAAARQLKGSGSMVLGIAAADMEDPFFGTMLSSIIRLSHRKGYALTLTGFDRRTVEPRDIQLLLEQDLSGLIIAGSGPVPWIAPFVNRGIPITQIGTGPRTANINRVGPDVKKGFASLVEHLDALGHRNLGFIGAKLDVHSERLELFRSLLNKSPMTLSNKHVHMVSAEIMKAGMTGASALLEQCTDLPSAIVCSSDAVAIGVIRALNIRGLRIPEDVSVTGLDDLAIAALSTPPLTTLKQPIEDMVERALDQIGSYGTGTNTTLLPVTLIERESTGPAGEKRP